MILKSGADGYGVLPVPSILCGDAFSRWCFLCFPPFLGQKSKKANILDCLSKVLITSVVDGHHLKESNPQFTVILECFDHG